MNLAQLKQGQGAFIQKVQAAGPLKRRLKDMGMVKGEWVEVEKVAPLGSPINIAIKGYKLSLRKDEAACITLKNDF